MEWQPMAAASMFDPPVVLARRRMSVEAPATRAISDDLDWLWDDRPEDEGGPLAGWWASLAAPIDRWSRSRGAWLAAALIVSLAMWLGIIKLALLAV
jgi:hypothetical protein